ncbi:MAG: glycosyltransferase [Chitinispirillales bacterium]|jgi:glycosyltransferase involved in cell wall biosynthesis|nr:glycosyltransferase [Chitinispirillales bacterium]
MKIIFTPLNRSENAYIDIMKSAYEIAGECEIVHLRGIKNLFCAKFIVLNWYENITPSKLLTKKIFWFSLRFLTIVILRLNRVKIIWTLHNKEPHGGRFAGLSKLMMKILANKSDFIIIHSQSSRQVVEYLTKNNNLSPKTVYVPLPNYCGHYGEMPKNLQLGDERLQILFLGGIREYKNVDILIEVAKKLNFKNLHLKIIGKCSKNYFEELENLTKDTANIFIKNEFVPDNLIPEYISRCHVLAAPYDTKTMLNSGTAILAFSYKRTIVSPAIGTLEDIKDKSLFFDYSYSSREEHIEKLSQVISKIYYEYEGKYNDLLKIGERCFSLVKKNNGIEEIVQILKEKVFEKIEEEKK